MAELEINGKIYPLRFGMGFLRTIDKTVQRETGPGVTEDLGFRVKIAQLVDGSFTALEEVILIANQTEKPRLSLKELDEWMENEDTDLKELYEKVIGFLENSNVCKMQVSQLLALVKNSVN